jgi:hypothetical protein
MTGARNALDYCQPRRDRDHGSGQVSFGVSSLVVGVSCLFGGEGNSRPMGNVDSCAHIPPAYCQPLQ